MSFLSKKTYLMLPHQSRIQPSILHSKWVEGSCSSEFSFPYVYRWIFVNLCEIFRLIPVCSLAQNSITYQCRNHQGFRKRELSPKINRPISLMGRTTVLTLQYHVMEIIQERKTYVCTYVNTILHITVTLLINLSIIIFER